MVVSVMIVVILKAMAHLLESISKKVKLPLIYELCRCNVCTYVHMAYVTMHACMHARTHTHTHMYKHTRARTHTHNITV